MMTIGAPFHRFMSLRSEAVRILALYEHSAEKVAFDSLRLRAREYSLCGTSLIAFYASNIIAARMLRSGLFFGMKFYPRFAGRRFIALADLDPRELGSYELEDEIATALRLNLQPAVSTTTTAIQKAQNGAAQTLSD
jgi:hypothetical protein